MTNQEAIDELIIVRNVYDGMREAYKPCVEAIDMAISALQAQEKKNSTESSLTQKALNTISRQAVIDTVKNTRKCCDTDNIDDFYDLLIEAFAVLPSAQPDLGKYEYHYDHTDCIWYRPEARNRCPVTCAQYRDGWNDAMNYIFRDGKGYRPHKRDEEYGE